MVGLTPSCDEDDEAFDEEPPFVVGDIVEVATRLRKPVVANSLRFDDVAQLRIIGEAEDQRRVFVMLVTQGDAEHVCPTLTVAKHHCVNFGVDERFLDCEGIIVSEHHVRRVVKQQRGAWCVKCSDYNEDVRLDDGQPWLCAACRDNPWR